MNAFSIPGAPAWFNLLLNLSLQASILAALIWILLKIFGRWIPPTWRALIWSLVILRVLIPYSPPSPLSFQNLLAKPTPTAPAPGVVITERKFAPSIQISLEATSNVFWNPISHTLPIEQKTQPAPPPSPRPLTLAWTIGALFFLTLLIARLLIIQLALRRSATTPTQPILEILAACRAALRLRYPLRITTSDQIAAPALTGLLPARLILPTNFTTAHFTPAQIRHILLHELAHIKQGHLLLHWLALLARALHWFNPAIHFAAAQLRQQCELAADAAALKNSTPAERTAYGETILQVLSQSSAPPTLLALGMAEQARHLKQRLRALTSPSTRSFHILGFTFITLIAGAGFTSAVQPKDPEQIRQATAAEIQYHLDRQRDQQTVRTQNLNSSGRLDTLRRENFENSKSLQDARFLIELGRLEEAEQILKRAVQHDTENRAAHYYLNLIKEQRYASVARQRAIPAKDQIVDIEKSWNQPAGRDLLPYARTNAVHTSPARKALYSKLESIRIDEFPLAQETDLVDVLKKLGNEVRKRDPSGRGVNFIISQVSERANPDSKESIIDPVTGLPTSPPLRAEVDVEKFKIKFDPPIRDVTLAQFLDAVVFVAKPQQPPPSTVGLRYSVEDYAVVFSARAEQRAPLYSRTFRVDPTTFIHGLTGVLRAPPSAAGNSTGITFIPAVTNIGNIQEEVRRFFAAAGVDFPTNAVATGGGAIPSGFGQSGPNQPPQKAIFFNDRTGVLLVRATLPELDIIENAIHSLNVTPPQVTITVQIFDLPAEQAARIKTNYVVNRYMTATNEFIFASKTVTNPPSPLLPPTKTILDAVKDVLTTTNQTFASEFILKPTVAALLVSELQSAQGVDALTLPNVTTLVGRQARVSLEETVTIVTADSLKSGGLPLPFGWSIDCTAETWDGLHLQLNTAAALTQFLGYEKDGETPLPRFQVRGTGSRVTLQPGHTQAFFFPAPTVNRVPLLADLPFVARLFKSTHTPRHLLILVTPVLTDPAGNVIHQPPQ